MIEQFRNKRYCIIGQPRCGSHWLAAAIAKQNKALDIGEYFHWWTARYSRYTLNDHYISRAPVIGEVDGFGEMYRRKDILSFSTEQPLVARMFILDAMVWNYTEIYELFRENNFEFIYLHRQLEPQIISYYFCKHFSKWSLHKFNEPMLIDIPTLKNYVFTYTRYAVEGERWLKDIPHTAIAYESLNIVEPNDNIKMMPEDPYELILNKAEVKEVFDHYMPKLLAFFASI